MYLMFQLFGQAEPVLKTFTNELEVEEFLDKIQNRIAWSKVLPWGKDAWYFNG